MTDTSFWRSITTVGAPSLSESNRLTTPSLSATNTWPFGAKRTADGRARPPKTVSTAKLPSTGVGWFVVQADSPSPSIAKAISACRALARPARATRGEGMSVPVPSTVRPNAPREQSSLHPHVPSQALRGAH